MSVPDDVAERTRHIARELPVSGGVRDGVWRLAPWSGRMDDGATYDLQFHGAWWICGPVGDVNLDAWRSFSDVRHFSTWDEVRVALDEVEERGSWWPE